MSERIVIGIDPGTAVTGYGVVCKKDRQMRPLDFGAIRPPKGKNSERRRIIFDAVRGLIERFNPEAVVVETQFVHRQNPLSAITLGMVRGIVILAATEKGVPVYEFAPAKIKRSVTGNGRASKQQMQGMMQRLLGLSEPVTPEDAADALALAFCHLQAQDSCLTAGDPI